MKDERDIEAKLVRLVRNCGGICLKLDSSAKRGIQDRLVLLPRARVVFVELKRPDGGKVSVLQKIRQRQIGALGFRSVVIDSEEELERLASEWYNDGEKKEGSA